VSERSERNPGITCQKDSKPALAGDRCVINNKLVASYDKVRACEEDEGLENRGQACDSAILLDAKRRLDFLAFINRKDQSPRHAEEFRTLMIENQGLTSVSVL
jgi:hypothetical protein